ncbi:MAG: ABC transporter ATP-binding protein [Alphaproteobacteria bacterium]|nr:ABC transporter ATP-binding protein [Alphaproteobacteria bacterium]
MVRRAERKDVAVTDRPALSVALEDISKTFGPVHALRPTSLSVEPGEMLALLGPSGCGKTTTLRVIAGFETPDTGTVRIGGVDVTDLRPNRRNLGMVFQNYSLFPHMTVGQNIAFGLRMRRVDKATQGQKVRDALALVRLAGFEDRFAHQLSGGQQQRVALARALVTDPSVLLLDEPLGALDKNLREGMQFELRQLQKRLDITSILVTHDQEEALTMSDRVAVLSAGEILQVGPPSAVYERPRNRFVSEFLGTANVFEATVERAEGGRLALAVAAGTATVRSLVPGEGILGGRRLVAVRPEKIDVARNGDGIPARVVEHVFRGSYHAYSLEVPGRAVPVFAYRQTPLVDGAALAPGDAVRLGWPAEWLVLLDDEAP